ncbi:MAG: hypothetical protein OEO79_05530 [Gemmatimonadota bacterium]|nr:hypothetical protein [Gemmatimonadota bacterium]
MRKTALIAIFAVLLLPAVLEAQVRILGGVGVTNPMSDLNGVADVGWHASAGLQLGIGALPVGIRADGAHHSFGQQGANPSADILSGALSLVFTFPGIGLSPYILGGLGAYRTGTDAPGAETESDTGIHGAFGVDIGALSYGGFAEVRLVNVGTASPGNRRYVSATIGFRL